MTEPINNIDESEALRIYMRLCVMNIYLNHVIDLTKVSKIKTCSFDDFKENHLEKFYYDHYVPKFTNDKLKFNM